MFAKDPFTVYDKKYGKQGGFVNMAKFQWRTPIVFKHIYGTPVDLIVPFCEKQAYENVLDNEYEYWYGKPIKNVDLSKPCEIYYLEHFKDLKQQSELPNTLRMESNNATQPIKD